MKARNKKLLLPIFILSSIAATYADDDLSKNVVQSESLADAIAQNSDSPTLEDIEVTAYRFPVNTLNIPVNAEIITRKEIEESGATNIPDILQKEGNVIVRSGTSSKSDAELSMRGFGENSGTRILVLVDGVKYNAPDLSKINWNSIPLYNVESIEVLKGSQTTMYGGDAEAGVIKISTIRPTDGFDSFVNAQYGSYDYYNITAGTSGRVGDFFYNVTLNTYNDAGYRDYSASWANYGSVMVGYDISDTVTLTLKGDLNDSFVEYPSPVSYDEMLSDPQYSPYAYGSFKDLAGRYTATLSTDGMDVKSNTTLGVYFRDRLTSYNQSDLWTYTFTPSFEVVAVEDLSIYTGLDTNYSTLYNYNSSYGSAPSKTDRLNMGLYAKGVYNLQEDWIISAGARVDTMFTDNSIDSNWDEGYSADIGVVYKLNENSSIFARFDQVFHYATIDEAVNYYTGVYDANLKPEYGQNFEIGYKFVNDNWSATVNGFLMYLQDEISYDPYQWANLNLDPTLRYGIDFALSYDDKYYGGSIMATLVNAEFASGPYAGNEIPLVSPFNMVAEVYVKPIEMLKLIARISYYTSSVMGSDFLNTQERIPDYFTIDLQANITVNENITIFGAIENVTDEVYATYAYYSSWYDSCGYYPASGLTLRAGVNIKF